MAVVGLLLLPAAGAALALSTPTMASGLDVGLRMEPDGEGGCTGDAILATPTVSASQVRSVGVSARLEGCVWRLTGMFFEMVDGSRCEMILGPDGAWLGDCGVDVPRQYPTGDHSDSRGTQQVAYAPHKKTSAPGGSNGPPPPGCESSYGYAWAKTYSYTGAGSSWERVWNKMTFRWDAACDAQLAGSSVAGDCSQHYGFHVTGCGPAAWNNKNGPHIWASTRMESNWNDHWHPHTTWAQTNAQRAGDSYTYGGSCPISGGLPSGAEHNCVAESGRG